MKTSNTVKRIVVLCLMWIFVLEACGCSKIFNQDDRTAEDYQAEATEIGEMIMKNMIAGQYKPIDKYISSADESTVEGIVNQIDSRLSKESLTTVVSVYTDPDTYATDIQFQISVYFSGNSIATACYLRLRRSGGSWVVANGGTLARDIEALNARFVEEKKKEDADNR